LRLANRRSRFRKKGADLEVAELIRSLFRVSLLLPALVYPLSASDIKPPAKGAQDDALVALVQKAMTTTDPAAQKAALKALQTHRFRSTRAPQREYALFAQGILEDRFETTLKAAETLKKLERTWPKSVYLPEAQTILGAEAVEHRRFREAETRLRKVLTADIPVEGKRRAQELLLWVFVEQGQPEKGLPVMEALFPLGNEKPSERGLVAMTEVLATAKQKDQAEAARKDYHTLYPKGTYGPRVELACARMLGALGEAKGSAGILQKLLLDTPDAPEADEARLALATLLSDGKLDPKEAQAFPAPDKLLSDIRKAEQKVDLGRRALLVRLRMSVNASRWKEAIDTAALIRAKQPTDEETSAVNSLRAGAFRAWAQELLDKQQFDPLLPHLDREGIQSLTTEQRKLLAERLSQVGLASAALALSTLAPPNEQPGLRRNILAHTQAEVNPVDTLKAMPGKGESSIEALKRAQAALTLKDWKAARAALTRAKVGPERMETLTTYLRRPLDPAETEAQRLKDAEGWLARAGEKGPDREGLLLLVADLRAKAGDWRGALQLYPPQSSKAQQGWVALMRATCQHKLGQVDAARATLKQAVDEPGFRMERESLARQLGKP